jgi:hypothetical protein
MKIDIKVQGIKELQANLKDFSERRVRSTVATAMTKTAVAVRNELQSKMDSALDRPIGYTRRNLRYTAATAKGLQATVGFDIVANQDMYGKVTGYTDMGRAQTPVGKYMKDQIEGGPRRDKRFEIALRRVGILPAGWFAVPGERAKIDAFGPLPAGKVLWPEAALAPTTKTGTTKTAAKSGGIAIGIDLATVEPRALVLVGQEIIGLRHLVEALGSLGVVLVVIGVQFLGQPAIGGLDVLLACAARKAKGRVRVFCHAP